MYRLGLMGSGNMARVHAKHWSRMSDVEIVGVVSHDITKARKIASTVNATAYRHMDEMLADANPDIIDICTPTPTHKEFALQSLAAGKPTFLEKPMGRSVAECDEIIAAVDKAKVPFMVGHVVRFFPEYAQAKRMVVSGAIGIPAAARAARLAGHPTGSWQNWYWDPAQSGGVILDMIIHDFDWMRWCLGDVDRVFAKGLYNVGDGKFDYGLVTLHFASGALGHVTGSWAHLGPFRTTFELCGDAGMLEHDSEKSVPFSARYRESETGAAGVAIPESPLFDEDDPYYRELRHFIDVIEGKAQPIVTAQDARAAVQIAAAALESIETGKPVSTAR